ncbi:NB-ARC domain-containing protein [Abeliophyllum distichum]|uniref:NB-ARC domain-containing protein n=1 Tax=Abeliophyllum distichum TaxID=126358 RepID=A0ABD1PPD2_9LAMI
MAYAALRSLAQILNQTLNRDHQYLILDEKQQIESLIEKVSSLQDFLENSSKKIKKHLEIKIRNASYIAEDIIESHITDRILSESASHEDGILEKISIRFNLIEKWIVSSSKPASSSPFLFPFLFRKRQNTLLRVLHQEGRLEFPNEVAESVDLRYLDCISIHIPSSISKLQNLQTIILRRDMRRPLYLSLDIWKMPQLRHVLLEYGILPDPSSVGTEGDRSVFVLENLQTLSLVMNFRCAEEVIKRIPSIKKLGIRYKDEEMDLEYYCRNNLVHLRKLESLKWINFGYSFLMNLSFPTSFLMNLSFLTSLKKLTLVKGRLSLEDILIVGSLPNLQVLKLRSTAFFRQKWITNAGEFLQLKYLLLENIALEGWRVDPTCFLKLESLVLKDCYEFVEIPDEIREIPTLRLIELNECGGSVLTSAMDIQEE